MQKRNFTQLFVPGLEQRGYTRFRYHIGDPDTTKRFNHLLEKSAEFIDDPSPDGKDGNTRSKREEKQ